MSDNDASKKSPVPRKAGHVPEADRTGSEIATSNIALDRHGQRRSLVALVGDDCTAARLRMTNNFASRQLLLFAIRSRELADRAAAGELGFIDAVDMAYSAADLAGLVESVGDDVVQTVLAAAFANARGP